MADRVAHEVQERFLQALHDVLVDLGFLAFDDDPNFLFRLASEITHHKRQPAEYLRDGDEPHARDRLPQFPQRAAESEVHLLQFTAFTTGPRDPFVEAGPVYHHLTD